MVKNLPPGLARKLKEIFGISEMHHGDPVYNLLSMNYKAASKDAKQKDA